MSVDHGRRKFLWESAALAGVALAPGIVLYDLAEGRPPGSGRVRVRCAGASSST